ncbi:haloacid dehalogenase type II [Zavarzinia aquatilis]|uniref:(S)-2-haloacid dehalogenase n=1 Tax=Zavarzinia aquatilis TaxID=2211142 RepID=A0A317DXL3_9PROT|nr:haloacid dehalogenase type II [Zavarzinia aquatilis]PWR19419.1 haloacid dehalogenase type II [Zavarzinia aquatilis]
MKPVTSHPLALDRRQMIGAGAAALLVAGRRPALAATRPKALAFDGFALFDLAPVFARAEAIFPGKGAALSAAWRGRIFEYTWLRVAAGRYEPFERCIAGALDFAVASLGLALSSGDRDSLLGGFATIAAFPDVAPALGTLRQAGLRLAVLANPSRAFLDRALANSGLHGLFDHVLSTDAAKTYKPDRAAYALGTEAFGLSAGNIGFVASAGWDAVGARWFGYRSYWLNRPGLPPEGLEAGAEVTVPGMPALAAAVLA